MGWLTRWLGLDAAATPYEFAAPTAPRPIDMVIGEMMRAEGRVTRADALSVPAVLRGRNLLCSIATLPLVQRDQARRTERSPLLGQVDADVPNVVTLSSTVEDLLFESVAWWRITAQDADGYPVKCRRLDPATVSTQPPTSPAPSPLPAGADPRGRVWIDGRPVDVASVIRFDSPNPPLLKAGARAIRRALMLDRLAELYADGGRPLDYFTQSDGADTLRDDEVRDFLDDWRAARRRRATAYIPAAVQYHEVDSPTPADLQLVGLQARASLDIANALGLDPEDLGISTTSRTYANAVDRRRDRVNDVLSPYMRAITDRLSMGDVTRRGHLVEFDLDDYLRADPKTRYEVYATAIQHGILDPGEARAEEGYPGPAPTAPAARGAPLRSVSAALSSEPTVAAVAVPTAQFAADEARRTITGVAMPYGRTARNGGHVFRFAPGALRFGEVGRVKLLRDHDRRQAIGRATRITEAADGLHVTFSVARGAEGDAALQLAADGVLDGLSVGVDFDSAADATLGDDGVLDVRRADLREVSLTAMPAYDDARVTTVAASADERNPMPGAAPAETAPAAPAPTTETAPAPSVTLSADQFAALVGGSKPAPKPVEGPTRVDPNHGVTTSVVEPAPYRFDAAGNLHKGSHDFSRDLFQAETFGDAAAHDRAMSFVRDTMSSLMFDVNTGNVAPMNPVRQRPDLFVDQKRFRYPVWEAVNKGALADITGFTFPKFGTATGLVGPHTEGVEPASGAYTATNQTVQPTAISGKAKITREVWDQGGNPQVSNLIWQKMVQGWYESLEARAVAVLDAATPVAIALTAGGGVTGQTLVAEIVRALSLLQYVRGGYRFTDAFAQVDLFTGLTGARDNDGRPIVPTINPVNASGRAMEDFSGVKVGPTTFFPAWALAASSANVASSYLFDRADVHGWASAPQRLDFNIEVAHVYIGIWGYAAAAISDLSGVREITYDPVP
ncbi:MAG: phage portal protein [Phycicoccus sp.]